MAEGKIAKNSFDYVLNAHNPKDWQKAITGQASLLASICDQNDIEYFICFGGLIGAVRHRGFTPWDNDLDFIMTEENYQKLIDLHKNGMLPDHYAFVTGETEDNYPLVFGRFVNLETSCPLQTSSFNGGSHGAFIDVFRMFPMPNDEALREEARLDYLVWEEYLCYVMRRASSRPDAFMGKWEEALAYESVHGRAETLLMLESRFRSHLPKWEEAKYCIWGSGGEYYGSPLMKTEWFSDSCLLPFEGVEFKAPVGYLELLDLTYGASWRLYPKTQKFEAYSCANLNIPGWVVSSDYMRFINQEESTRDFLAWKFALMEDLAVGRAEKRERAKKEAKIQGEKIESFLGRSESFQRFSEKIRSSAATCSDQLASEAEKACRSLFEGQEKGDLCKERIPIPVSSEYLYAALWARYIARDDFWALQKFLRTREGYEAGRVSRLADDRLSLFLRILQTTSELYDSIDRNDPLDARESAACLEQLCPQSGHVVIGRAFSYFAEGAYERVLQETEKQFGQWPANPYLAFYRACALYLTGRELESLELMGAVYHGTNNGMVKLSLADFCEKEGISLSALPFPRQAEEPKIKKQPVLKKKPLGRPIGLSRRVARKARRVTRAALRRLKGHCPMPIRRRDEPSSPLGEYAATIKGYRRLRRLTSNRFNVWESIYPNKDAILLLIEDGKIAQARKLARPYFEAVYRLMEKDSIGLFVDQDLHDALLPIIREEKGARFADGFVAAIPDGHKESIDSLLRRKGVKHPYLK